MLENENIIMRKAVDADKHYLYELIVSHDEWTTFNGSYLPYSHPTLEECELGVFRDLREGEKMLIIEHNAFSNL